MPKKKLRPGNPLIRIIDFFYCQLRSRFGFMILNGMILLPENQNFPPEAKHPELLFARLEMKELLKFSDRYPEVLHRDLLTRISGRGDICYGFLNGDRIVSFCWYSNVPAEFYYGLELNFDSRYVYSHNAYTIPEYRNKGLLALIRTEALKRFQERGGQGLISYIEANNFPSLKSVKGTGGKLFGYLFHLRLIGRSFFFSTPGCRSYKFFLKQA